MTAAGAGLSTWVVLNAMWESRRGSPGAVRLSGMDVEGSGPVEVQASSKRNSVTPCPIRLSIWYAPDRLEIQKTVHFRAGPDSQQRGRAGKSISNPYYLVHLMYIKVTTEPIKNMKNDGSSISIAVVCSPKTFEVLDGSVPFDL